MTTEEIQDSCLKLAAEWRKLATTVADDQFMLINGKQFRGMCETWEIVADCLAKIVERV